MKYVYDLLLKVFDILKSTKSRAVLVFFCISLNIDIPDIIFRLR